MPNSSISIARAVATRIVFPGAAAALLVGACAGETTPTPTPPEPQNNPTPVLLGGTPELVVGGGTSATVILRGEGFVRSSRVRWNEGDRVTRYDGPTQLAVELTASDLNVLGAGRVVVYNPPPGGGTSGTLPVTIGWPRPALTEVTPTVAEIGQGDLTLTLKGTGFVRSTGVLWNEVAMPVTYVSPTEITARVTAQFYLQTAGVVRVTASNPTPGGGRSNAVEVTVGNPAPRVTSVSPDTLVVGAAATVTVEGTRFVARSVVRVNGADRPTTFVSATRLTAQLPATDLAASGVLNVTVANPTPGGGESSPVPLRLRDAPPRIVALVPAQATAGASAVDVTVRGVNFTAASAVTWNGTPRPVRHLDATTLVVTLAAGDVARPGGGRLVVTNAGSSGVSAPVTLPIVAAAPAPPAVLRVPIRTRQLAYDSTRGLLYGSVPSTAAAFGNSIVALDPTSGQVRWSVPIGSEPSQLALSDDGRFLYVGLLGAQNVARVDLASRVKDLEFSLGQGTLGPSFAEDLVVLPGDGRSVVVSRRNACCSPRHDGVTIYDDGVARGSSTQGHTGSNRIARGPSPQLLIGYNNETTEFALRRILVTPGGLREELVRGGVVSGFGVDIETDGDRVYATTGVVVDAATLTRIGSFATGTLIRPDERNGRMHAVVDGRLTTYNYFTFTPIGSLSLDAPGSTSMVRWGSDGLALGGGEQLILLRSALVGG
jgi:hypothetical protein